MSLTRTRLHFNTVDEGASGRPRGHRSHITKARTRLRLETYALLCETRRDASLATRDTIQRAYASCNAQSFATTPISKAGDTALFFGLSGTGKTTLSVDPTRALIGDDEHGWDDDGVFNFEGGCYAKTIDLSEATEPDIFSAIRPNAMLENVWIDAASSAPDYFNASKTENGRVSYPIDHIPHHEPNSRGSHPTAVLFLTCDAYGVLPPVSKLSAGQAQYHFLSGYTAKVAGTERGVTEPQATFSTCFGAAFMTLHPTTYADLLKKKLQQHQTPVYLINTGWTGGVYGVGKRMKLPVTRKCVEAVLDGRIEDASFVTDPLFGFAVPTRVEGVPSEMLSPRESWTNKAAFDETALKLARAFQDNFKQFILPENDLSVYGPNV